MHKNLLPYLHDMLANRTRCLSCLLILALLTLSPSIVRAEGALAQLPLDTLGFVHCNDLSQLDGKATQLAQEFELPLPSLVGFAHMMTGIKQGIDLSGEVVFAMLSSGGPTAVPAPVLLLPVSDYAQFAESVSGDGTGEICRITIVGENLLVAQHGSYALIMNPEHRERMEAMLAKTSSTAQIAPSVKTWMKQNDVTAALLPHGIDFLVQLNRSAVEEELTSIEDPLGEPDLANDIRELKQFLQLLEFAHRKVEILAFGVAVDDATNLRARWKAHVSTGAQRISNKTPQSAMLKDLAAKPFITAGSGALFPHWHEPLARFFTTLAQQYPESDGYEEFTDADWQDLYEYYRLSLEGVREFSFIVTSGEDDAPLLSNIFALVTTERSAEYLERLKKATELVNSLNERSTNDIKIQYETEPVIVGGAAGYALVADIAEATGDAHVDIWQNLLTEFLGKDGKMKMYFCALDEEQIVIGLQSEDKLARFIEESRLGEGSLTQDPQVRTTMDLVDKDNCFIQLVNPQQVVEFVDATMATINPLGPFGVPPQQPEYRQAPPFAVTFAVRPSGWTGEVVAPLEAVTALSQYLQAKQGLNQ